MLGKRGLVSVTFRKLSPDEIVRLCKANGLESVEWGADVHVPPTDLENARRVGALTRENGLETVSYGSYHALGRDNACDAETLLLAADALGTKNLRVWAGCLPSKDTDEALFARIVAEARDLSDRCAAHGMTLSFEYHMNTLTDGREAAVRLMTAVDHPNCYTYWQPVQTLSRAENLLALREVLPWLSNVHVFEWRTAPDGSFGPDRRPLSEGAETWQAYLALLGDARTHNLQLEFVRGDDPRALSEDAAALLSWK